MKLSRTIMYALQATLQLAEAGPSAPVPCSRLAEHGKMPERFLLQILRNLVTHGLLRSTRGVEGGYTLVRAPEDISLLDLIEAIDGPMLASLPRDDGLTPDTAAHLQEVMSRVIFRLREELQQVRLVDFMERSESRPSTVEAK